MEKRSKRKAPIRFTATLYRPAETGAPVNRFSVGRKNKDLKRNSDGSLTIYMQAGSPSDGAHRTNWLPAAERRFFYVYPSVLAGDQVTDGSWTPPAVERQN
jgi:hypothetical protein